jgi:hypothetical protein
MNRLRKWPRRRQSRFSTSGLDRFLVMLVVCAATMVTGSLTRGFWGAIGGLFLGLLTFLAVRSAFLVIALDVDSYSPKLTDAAQFATIILAIVGYLLLGVWGAAGGGLIGLSTGFIALTQAQSRWCKPRFPSRLAGALGRAEEWFRSFVRYAPSANAVHFWDDTGCHCRRCEHENHEWSGCKCEKCGRIRDSGHIWSNCKCKKCGRVRDSDHAWIKPCKCGTCGARRVEFCEFTNGRCRICGERCPHRKFDRCVCTACGECACGLCGGSGQLSDTSECPDCHGLGVETKGKWWVSWWQHEDAANIILGVCRDATKTHRDFLEKRGPFLAKDDALREIKILAEDLAKRKEQVYYWSGGPPLWSSTRESMTCHVRDFRIRSRDAGE